MGKNVYIGYSKKDKESVLQIKAELESLTNSSFIILEKDIEGLPEQYVLDAISSINKSDVFLFILSDHSQLSDTALMELSFARKKVGNEKRSIFHVIIDECKENDSFMFRRWKEKAFKWNCNSEKMELVKLLASDANINCTSSNKLHIIVKDGKKGFVNYKGDIVIPCKWEDIDDFYEGFAPVNDGSGKWGFLDVNGERIIPCTWQKVTPFEDGMSVVKSNNKYGVIDKNDNLIMPISYSSLEYIGESLFKVYDGWSGYYIININGEKISPRIWKSIDHYCEGLCSVSDSNHKYGFIDTKGKLVIDCWWNSTWGFSDGLALVSDDHAKYGFINNKGEVHIPCYRKKLDSFNEGLAAFKENGKMGFINKDDAIVISPVWDSAVNYCYRNRFKNGRCGVSDDKGMNGYIDTTGSLVIPYQWERIEEFEDGTAWVFVDSTWKLIDMYGNYFV